MARDLAELTERVAAELELRGVPYAVGGAICMATWGFPRTTRDLDVNVFVGERELAPVLDALDAAGCTVPRAAAIASAAERGDFTVIADGTRVDVFVSFHPLHEAVGARRVRVSLASGREVSVLSAEDLVVFKALFGRTKDFADIERIAAGRAELDAGYILTWLETILGGADPRLERVRSIIGVPH